MNLDQQIALIWLKANEEVVAELLYRRDELDRDDEDQAEYTLVSALEDAYQLVDERPSDFSRSYRENMRDLVIALGWYTEVSDAQRAATVSTGKTYAFKHRQKYWVWARESA